MFNSQRPNDTYMRQSKQFSIDENHFENTVCRMASILFRPQDANFTFYNGALSVRVHHSTLRGMSILQSYEYLYNNDEFLQRFQVTCTA